MGPPDYGSLDYITILIIRLAQYSEGPWQRSYDHNRFVWYTKLLVATNNMPTLVVFGGRGCNYSDIRLTKIYV